MQARVEAGFAESTSAPTVTRRWWGRYGRWLASVSDLPALGVAGDRVDEELTRRPRRWDMGFIRRFMLEFGLLSSAFDFVTFAALLFVFRTGPVPFADRLGFRPLAPALLRLLVAIALVYVLAAEVIKYFFYRREEQPGQGLKAHCG